MKPIFLVGYMGSGKTTLGRALAKVMNREFIDLDIFIEARYHDNIRGIFAKYGEDEFRNIERHMLLEVGDFEDVIIACGGGTPCYFDNMEQMSQRGVTVYLTTPEDCLFNRLSLPGAKLKRPLIANKTNDEIRQFIHEALVKRDPFYSKADMKFDSTDIETAETIIAAAHRLRDEIMATNKL